MNKIILIVALLCSGPLYAYNISDLAEVDFTKLDNKAVVDILLACEVNSDEDMATGKRMETSLMLVCSSASSEVRKRLFDDDFSKFLEWRKSRTKK